MLFLKNCWHKIHKIQSKETITINDTSYKVTNIVHRKVISNYIPHIPIILIDKTLNSEEYISELVNNISFIKNEIILKIILNTDKF